MGGGSKGKEEETKNKGKVWSKRKTRKTSKCISAK